MSIDRRTFLQLLGFAPALPLAARLAEAPPTTLHPIDVARIHAYVDGYFGPSDCRTDAIARYYREKYGVWMNADQLRAAPAPPVRQSDVDWAVAQIEHRAP